MKILHINCNFFTNPLHEVMRQVMKKRGLDVTMYVPTQKEYTVDAENVVVRKCFKKNHRFLYFVKQNLIMKALKNAINPKDFDCVHAFTVFTDGNVAYRLKKEYGIPYYVAVRATDCQSFIKRRPYLRFVGRRVLRNADGIYFLSKPYKDQIINKFMPAKDRKEMERKSQIVPNGINPFWFENKYSGHKLPDDEIKIVQVSQIKPIKNIPTTLKAIEKLNEQGYKTKLILVGKKVKEETWNEIKDNPFLDYRGFMNKEELIKIYREADIFVMPSLHETFGMVYAEAMTQGLPVVYTRNEGFDKQFEEGEAGFSVDPLSVDEIVESILKIIKDYDSFSGRIPEMTDKFNWDRIIDIYSENYNKSVGGK